jgi:hypothetical protein
MESCLWLVRAPLSLSIRRGARTGAGEFEGPQPQWQASFSDLGEDIFHKSESLA